MALKTIRFLSLLFAALALVPAGAHLFELPNKIGLSAADYLTVQQIYRGWALFGFVVLPVLVLTLTLTIMSRGRGDAFIAALIAFLCIAGTQVVFWTYTYPANAQTNQWTMLPASWEQLRMQWEYSHAASAVLNLIAVIALILSVLLEPAGEQQHA